MTNTENVLTNEFGDLFVLNLNVNFVNNKTEIIFGKNLDSLPIKKMLFNDVIWQEFSEFDFENIFNSIEIFKNFESFYNAKQPYFNKMKNYISSEKMLEIRNPNLFYYSFLQTSGMNCFVITKAEVQILFV